MRDINQVLDDIKYHKQVVERGDKFIDIGATYVYIHQLYDELGEILEYYLERNID
jgi:hypothetical protein